MEKSEISPDIEQEVKLEKVEESKIQQAKSAKGTDTSNNKSKTNTEEDTKTEESKVSQPEKKVEESKQKGKVFDFPLYPYFPHNDMILAEKIYLRLIHHFIGKNQSLSSILGNFEKNEELINNLSEEDKRGESDVRVAIIGNVDSGKSTLVGVLSKGELDDGRGGARKKVFNFTHEAENGRTSSISQEIMGFDDDNKWVEPERITASKNQSWGYITEKSKKLITFIDLCGHEKYLKTTMFGLVGLLPDYCLIVIGANMGITRMTREHLVIALALKVPIFVVITKVDIAPEEVYEKTMNKLETILSSRSAGKKPHFVKAGDDIAELATDLYSDTQICPIFSVSNVGGEGIDMLKLFMSHLKSRIYLTGKFKPPSEPVEFMIDGFYIVTGVGGVVAGTLVSGTVKLGDTLLLGPDSTGDFKPVIVRGIHYKRTSVEEVVSGQVCCFNIKPQNKKEQMKRSIFRKGMMLIGKDAEPESIWEFTAEIVILHNPTTIKPKYQAVIHCGVIRQAAKIVSINKDHLKMGDKGYVHFKFMYRPEYLKEGAALMMREGRTKGLGTICSVVRPSKTKKTK
jgi:GTPase